MLVRMVSSTLLFLLWSALPSPAQKLAVANVTIHQWEDGPAVPSSQDFVPGDIIFFSCQVSGYKVSEEKQVLLRYQIEAMDSGDVRIVEDETGTIEAELAPQDKDWFPKIRHSLMIPPLADSGNYRILVSVTDELGGRTASAKISFPVRGHYVKPSDVLVVRNFRFQRSEGDMRPLDIPAYRAGDALWARFDMTGYRIEENNHYQVAYGLSVLNPVGKVLYSQPEAATEDESPFYPKRYVPGVLSLQLQPKTAPGDYTIVLSVRDEIGEQTYESRQIFHIE